MQEIQFTAATDTRVLNRNFLFLYEILAATEPGYEILKNRGDAAVKLDEVAKIMAAGTHANVKYTKSGPGRNENEGQSIMKKKRKDDSALCLGM